MTAIICIALFLGGFLFPPLWLGLVGYIVYLFTRKTAQHTKLRYDVAMGNAIKQLSDGTVSAPSWASDAAAAKFLLAECIKAAIEAGLDARELADETVGEAFAAIAMTAAYHFEKQGFSRSEQIVGAIDLSVNYSKAAHSRNGWDRFFDQQKAEGKCPDKTFNKEKTSKKFEHMQKQEILNKNQPVNNEENPFMNGSISPLLIMQSAKIIYKSEKLQNMTRDWLGGSVIEVMISTPNEDAFFVYYENDDYYYNMANGMQSLSSNINGDDYRNNASKALCKFLIAYVYENFGKDIRHPQMQFSHNRIHTNVIAYVERLGEWYPIQHNSSEDDDTTERKVSRINNKQSDVRDFVAIDRLSPS